MMQQANEQLFRTPASQLTANEQLTLLKDIKDSRPDRDLWQQLKFNTSLQRILREMDISPLAVESAEMLSLPKDSETEQLFWPRNKSYSTKYSLVIHPIRAYANSTLRFWQDVDTAQLTVLVPKEQSVMLVNTNQRHTWWNHGLMDKPCLYLHLAWNVSLLGFGLVNTDSEVAPLRQGRDFGHSIGPYTAKWLNRTLA